ncbi:30S ribosomal protein S24e [sediment metagenome]|uniref:30S ribosomal protein S24e n=1 Tax=sediment metagenome TaxID=749907 RepID=D9PM37_9ZZZZ
MELTITNKKENKILQRTEIQAKISFTGATPSNKQVQEEIAKKLNAGIDLVVTKQILTTFGNTQAEVKAYVYNTIDQMKKIEPKIKEKPKAK